MTKPLTATCYECNSVTRVNFLEVPKPNGIKVTSFRCTHCQQEYVCFVTNHEVRRLHKVKASLTGNSNWKKRLEIQEEINKKMDVLKNEWITNGT